MPKYVSLIRFTDQGARGVKNSTTRAQAFAQAAAKAGVRVEAQYWTLGSYDGILILDADTEQKALRCLAELESKGAVRANTMPAFDARQFRALTGR